MRFAKAVNGIAARRGAASFTSIGADFMRSSWFIISVSISIVVLKTNMSTLQLFLRKHPAELTTEAHRSQASFTNPYWLWKGPSPPQFGWTDGPIERGNFERFGKRAHLVNSRASMKPGGRKQSNTCALISILCELVCLPKLLIQRLCGALRIL